MNKNYGKITALFISLLLLIGFTACNNAATPIVPLVSTDTSGNGETSETPTESKTLSSISVSGSPSKTVYLSGESFDSSGITVTATYSDGSTGTVTTYTNDLGTDICYNGKALTLSYTYNSVTKTASLTGPFYIAASDALTQTVQNNSTITISGTSFQLVKFGDFPQTIAASGITYSSSTVYNGWYLGSDGYFYESCSANPYTDNSNYTCSDGTTLVDGTTYYFKVQPIEWRVLTGDYNSTGKKLLLAEKILTANVPYYYSDSVIRIIGTDTSANPNNYKYSQIRAYLNGLNYYNDSNTTVTTYNENGFLQKAFTTSAQALIETTSVDNSAASTNPVGILWNNGTNDKACDNTNDKIFLLSEQEVTTSAYGFAAYDVGIGNPSEITESSRVRQTTDYAKANYARQNTTSGYGGYWWLRSPSYNLNFLARNVINNGKAGDQSNNVKHSYEGVCPALSISF